MERNKGQKIFKLEEWRFAFWEQLHHHFRNKSHHAYEGLPLTLTSLTGDTQAHWFRLLIGMLLTLILSLSIHVFMLQVLGIPFPDFAHVSAWAAYLNTTLSVLAVFVVCDLARSHLRNVSPIFRYLAIFLLYAMLKEWLRGVVMNGVVTTAWTFDIVAGLPDLAYALGLTSMVVFAGPKIRGLWLKIPAAAVIVGLMMFAGRPLLNAAFAPALKAAARFNHAEVYSFPYGWQVLVPAYVTYAEPVVACMLLAVLTWESLSTVTGLRLLQFTLLVLLIRGMLLPTLVYSFYSNARLPKAMLSQSQFLFETIALAVLTSLTWQFSSRIRDQQRV